MSSRFWRYLLVGGFATAAHWGLLTLLVEFARWPAWLGSGAGAILGAVLAFAGNRRFTFDHQGARLPAFLRFALTAMLGALLGMVIVAAGAALGLHYLAAQAIATAISVVVTFRINRHWSFAS